MLEHFWRNSFLTRLLHGRPKSLKTKYTKPFIPFNWEQYLVQTKSSQNIYTMEVSLHSFQSNSKSRTHYSELSAGSDHPHIKVFWQTSIRSIQVPHHPLVCYSSSLRENYCFTTPRVQHPDQIHPLLDNQGWVVRSCPGYPQVNNCLHSQ